jgi:hypothetical protein
MGRAGQGKKERKTRKGRKEGQGRKGRTAGKKGSLLHQVHQLLLAGGGLVVVGRNNDLGRRGHAGAGYKAGAGTAGHR